MSSQIKHWFFLYFVNGDPHIFPQKMHMVRNIEIYTAIVSQSFEYNSNNWDFVINHYLRKRYWDLNSVKFLPMWKLPRQEMAKVIVLYSQSEEDEHDK